MPDMKDDIDRSIAALQAVKLVRDCYSSGAAGRIQDILEMLAMQDDGMGQFGGLRRNIADAISKAYLDHPFTGTSSAGG
jgi:hypothetical protein